MQKQYYETVNALPTVKELREISKDRPDTFLNGALYIIDLLEKVNLSTHDREANLFSLEDMEKCFTEGMNFDINDLPTPRVYFNEFINRIKNKTTIPSPPSQ